MRPWLWWFVVFAGTLPVGGGLRYYLVDGPDHTTTRNWLVLVQIIVGAAVVGFALWRIINAGHAVPVEKKDEKLRITE